MQNLLDTHMSVAGIKQITNPLIFLIVMNLKKNCMTWEQSFKSRCDVSHMTKSIKANKMKTRLLR